MRYEFFAASNGRGGFVNYFPQVFNERACARLFIIKGGPGTGKSRFMREVADAAEARGLGVKYYYCSSDPKSLDGIIIEEMRLGFLDGTPPHACEPTLAGAREQIIDLGAFWNEAILQARRDEIRLLASKKTESYKRAYTLLGTYGNLLDAEESLVFPFVDQKKMSGAVKRWLHKLPEGEAPAESIGICRGFGMCGRVKLDTYEKSAQVLFNIADNYRCAHLLLGEIRAEALKRNMSLRVSFDPVMPSRVDAVCLCDAGVTFAIGEGGERRINMKRFIDEEGFKPHKEAFKRLENLANGVESAVGDCFFEVEKNHFALEKIYADAMDFASKEEFSEKFIKKLFKKSQTT